MPKRGSESGQMRREDYEAMQDGEGEVAGVWKKASSDVLRKRKIIKVRRKKPAAKGPAGGASIGSKKSANKGIFGSIGATFGSGASQANANNRQDKDTRGGLFSGVTSFGQNNSTKVELNSTNSQKSAALSNGSSATNATGGGLFGGTFGTGNAASKTSNSNSSIFSFGNKKLDSVGSDTSRPAAKARGGSFPNFSNSSTSVDAGKKTEAITGLKRTIMLNLAFADWVRKQHSKNPSVPWAKGLQGYLKQLESSPAKKPKSSKKLSSFQVPSLPKESKNKNSSSNFSFKNNADVTLKVSSQPTASSFLNSGKPISAKEKQANSFSNGSVSSEGDDGDERELWKQRVKILRFRKDDAEQPWGDMGIHQVSVMTSDATKKSRILARDETPLAKLQINANLYKGIKVERSGKRGVQIYLVVDDGKMTMYLIRCKSGDIADTLCKTIKDASEGDVSVSSSVNSEIAKPLEAIQKAKEPKTSESTNGGDDGDERELWKQRVKILRFRKDDAEQPWGDMGIHQVSVMTSDATKKSRILARDETPLAKLQINANLYKGIKVERSGKRGVQIYLVVDDGKMTMYLIRCKSGDIADTLCKTIKDASALC